MLRVKNTLGPTACGARVQPLPSETGLDCVREQDSIRYARLSLKLAAGAEGGA
jgi:hypothetical protein